MGAFLWKNGKGGGARRPLSLSSASRDLTLGPSRHRGAPVGHRPPWDFMRQLLTAAASRSAAPDLSKSCAASFSLTPLSQ